MSNNLLAAALSSVADIPITSYEDFKKIRLPVPHSTSEYQPLQLYALHETHIVTGPVLSTSTSTPNKDEVFLIYISTLIGDHNSIPVKQSNTVEDIKRKLFHQDGIPIKEQSLYFGGKKLKEGAKLSSYNIRDESILHLVKDSSLIYIPDNFRAPKFDYDYRKEANQALMFKRGLFFYVKPCGWNRIAFNVLDTYGVGLNDNFDPHPSWFGGPRVKGTEMGTEEWPISYHGIGRYKGHSIAEDGYRLCKGRRFEFDHGIYTTPDIDVAERYASTFNYDGDTYMVLMQNRINPFSLEMTTSRLGGGGVEYWITPNLNDIRPFGICVKKVDSKMKTRLTKRMLILVCLIIVVCIFLMYQVGWLWLWSSSNTANDVSNSNTYNDNNGEMKMPWWSSK